MNAKLSDYITRLDGRLGVGYFPKGGGYLQFKVNEKLCVYYEQRDFTLNLLSNISKAVLELNVNVRLDLSRCEEISASALVMLFAEVSRARMAKENDAVIDIVFPPFLDKHWCEAMKTGYRDFNTLFDRDHTFQTVSDPNKAMASILKLLHKSGVILNRPDTRTFTKGVNEAMLNVIHHAYSDQEDPLGGIGRRWWQACWLQGDRLIYIIYDLGCGMLNSLPSLDNEVAAEHLSRAMSYGVTRTSEQDRGKGTKNMEDATDIREQSVLFIGTNNAVYTKIEGQEPKVENTLLPFIGTLVEWQIRV